MELSRFDLNLLRALDILLEERNVTRAAARLFVTQQATSAALQRLRNHFGDQLLTRVGRRLEPTPLALSLIMPVREALIAAQAALDTQPVFNPLVARRTCRIVMSDYGLLVLLPRFLRRLAQEAPNIDCIIEPLTKDSFDRVSNGDLDFCMTADDWRLYGRRLRPGTVSEPMFHDDFVCVVDEAQTGIRDEISLETYSRLKHNSVAFGQGIATIVEQAWAMAGLEVEVSVTAPTFAALILMLPGTPFIATAQRRLAKTLAPVLGLRVVECPLPIPALQENLIWHERNTQDPSHAYLRNLLKEAAADLDAPAGSGNNAAL
jgi:LysR family transcriptional regulator, nod-box dependent transcriptional activator